METNTEALIAEVKTDLSKYDAAGLLDEDSMYRDIVLALKEFGNDIIQHKQEKVLEVKNGYAELPLGFFSLHGAFLCDPLHYKRNSVTPDALQTSWFYKERVERSTKWNECDAACCDVQEEKIIRENIYFKGGSVDFFYHKPRLLKLGAAFKRSMCANDCRNKIVKSSPDEITILNLKTLQTNFNSGTVYMIYYGLEQNEKGTIEMPDTPTGRLERYIEYYVKRRAAEKLMGNNDAIGLANLYGAYFQNERELKPLANYELKMMDLTPAAMKDIKRQNRLRMMSYEMIGNWGW